MGKLAQLLSRFNPLRKTVTEGSIITDYPPFANPMGGINYPLLAGMIIDRMERKRGGNTYERFTQDQLVFVARYLEKYNPFAQAILGALKGYTLGVKGMTPTCTAKPGQDEGLVTEAQAYIDHFRDVEDWAGCRERETYNRAHRDGNALLRFWVENSDVRCGYIEPEALQAKDGSDEWTFGVKTHKHNTERVEAYGVQWGADDHEEVDASEVYHLKCNVDRCIKLGLSDFASIGEVLGESYKVYRNFTTAEAVRQSYTYIRQHAEGVSAGEIDSFHDQAANYKANTTSLNGLIKDFKLQFEAGVGVEDISSGMELAAVPSAENMPGVIAGINAALLMAGVRYQMPLWLIAGDMSQNNVVDLGDESGFATYIRGEQAWYGKHQRNIYWRVLQIGAAEGHIPEAVLEAVDIEVKPQSPPPRDPKAATERNQTLFNAGRMSGRTWDAAEGLDTAKEQDEIKREGPRHLLPAPAEKPAVPPVPGDGVAGERATAPAA